MPTVALDSRRGLTRRALIKLGGATGLAMTTGGTALARQVRRPSHLRRSSFVPLVGQRFAIAGAGASALQLLAVSDLSSGQRDSENAFALTFAGPRTASAPVTTLPELRHPVLGSFPLFVTEGATTAASQHYDAVINRVHA